MENEKNTATQTEAKALTTLEQLEFLKERATTSLSALEEIAKMCYSFEETHPLVGLMMAISDPFVKSGSGLVHIKSAIQVYCDPLVIDKIKTGEWDAMTNRERGIVFLESVLQDKKTAKKTQDDEDVPELEELD